VIAWQRCLQWIYLQETLSNSPLPAIKRRVA